VVCCVVVWSCGRVFVRGRGRHVFGCHFVGTQGGEVGPGGPNPGLGWGVPTDTLLLEPVVMPTPQRRTWKSRFLPDRLYQYYQHQSAWMLAQVPPDDARYKEIPPHFTRVFPLDVSEFRGTTGRFGYMTSVFKVTSTVDGMTYALRRVDNVRSSTSIAKEAVRRWQVSVAGVVRLHDAFVDHGGTLSPSLLVCVCVCVCVCILWCHVCARILYSGSGCTHRLARPACPQQPFSLFMSSAPARKACDRCFWTFPDSCCLKALCGRTHASW